MADPAIVDYLKQNLPQFGAAVLRERMLLDGVSPQEFDEALKELQVPLPTLPPLSLPTPAMPPPVEQMPPPPTLASPPGRPLPPNTAPSLADPGDQPPAPSLPKFSTKPSVVAKEAAPAAEAPKKKRGLAFLAVMGGGILLIVAGLLSQQKGGAKGEAGSPAPAVDDGLPEPEDGVYRGHYGYLFKMPKGYKAWGTFNDPRKTEEIVYIFPKGTNHSHFIHEGLYGSLGILKLEVMPRRVPQGFIGIDTLKAWVTGKLTRDKATFNVRELDVNGKPAFIVNSEKPFKYARAYLVGAKVRYTLIGGEENALFVDVLSSLHEASPHDRPGE